LIKNKILLLIGLISLTIFTLSAGTIAFFSDEAIISGSKISAGTLYIGGDNGSRGVLDSFISLEDLVPGEEPKQVKIKVKNLGTMTAYINGISARIRQSDEMFMANALRTVCSHRGDTLFSGSLLALDGNVVPLMQEIPLEPEEVIELEFDFQLDERVSNWYKGKKVEFLLSVYAGQKPGQEVGNRVIMAGENNVQDCLDGALPGDVVLIPAGVYGKLYLPAGVAAKAGGVVFDTVAGGFTVGGQGNGKQQHGTEGPGEFETVIQGFTINSEDFGVKLMPGHGCQVTDNIFNVSGRPVEVSGTVKAVITRNDFTGSGAESLQKDGKSNSPVIIPPGTGLDAWYNLGVDLDPEEHAL